MKGKVVALCDVFITNSAVSCRIEKLKFMFDILILCCRIYWPISVFQTSRVMCTYEKASALGRNTFAFFAALDFTVQRRAVRRYRHL